jgi:hypothetical protein
LYGLIKAHQALLLTEQRGWAGRVGWITLNWGILGISTWDYLTSCGLFEWPKVTVLGEQKLVEVDEEMVLLLSSLLVFPRWLGLSGCLLPERTQLDLRVHAQGKS